MPKVKVGKRELWNAIRFKCNDCSCGSKTEVANCRVTACALHPYRLGQIRGLDASQDAQEQKS